MSAPAAWELRTATADGTRAVATALAEVLRPGDLLVLDGPLGAGKTTFTQGLGGALGVRGPVASPTFVISRVHPSEVGGPALVHVDAYRLGGGGDIDDLDLEADLADAVTVVEWGRDVAWHLTDSPLLVELSRPEGAETAAAAGTTAEDTTAEDTDDLDEPRTLRLLVSGPRWDDAARTALAEALGASGLPWTATPTDGKAS